MTTTRQPRVRWGPVLMLLAALSFTMMVACVKMVRTDLSPFDVVWWRGLVSVPLCAIAVPRGSWRIQNHRWFAVRVLFGFTAMVGYYTAAGGLPVANLTLINRLQPFAIAFLTPLFLGAAERPDARTWRLSLLGVAGCGVLLAPALDSSNTAGLFALLTVVTSGVSHTALRALGPTEHSATVVFWFQVLVTLGALVWVVGRDGAFPAVPATHLLPWLFGVGLFATLGQSFLARAYQLDRAALVAAASHASPVFAFAVDYIVFAHTPDWTTLVGGGIVLVAALLLVLQPAPPPPAAPDTVTSMPR